MHACSQRMLMNTPFLTDSNFGYFCIEILQTQPQASPGKKIRICSICGKSLSTTTGYNQHLKHHMGIYKHICKECGKAFTAKVGLENHIRREHQGKLLSCEVCGTEFLSYQGYVWHKSKLGHWDWSNNELSRPLNSYVLIILCNDCVHVTIQCNCNIAISF